MPVNTPLPIPIVAIDVALLVHVPPDRPSVKVVVAPAAQTVDDPLIAGGVGYMVTVAVAGAQPVVNV
jgi:hypothetical protein